MQQVVGQKGWSRTDCAMIFDNDGYLYIFRASEFDWNGDALLGRFRHQRQLPQIRNGLQVSRYSSIAECCKENDPTIFRISTTERQNNRHRSRIFSLGSSI